MYFRGVILLGNKLEYGNLTENNIFAWHLLMEMHTALERVSPDCFIIPCFVVTNTFFCVILGIKRHFVFMRATLLLSNEYFDDDCSRIPILSRCFNLFLYQKNWTKIGLQSISK